jgi:hypothetical protein
MNDIVFEFERATKNCYRFKEAEPKGGAEPVVGTLYVKQSAFDGEPPVTLIVTIKEG